MWSKIKLVFNNILIYGLTELAKQFLLIVFGTSIAALVASFLSNFRFLNQYRIWIIFIFGILGAILSIILFRKFTPIITVYKSFEGDYKILKDEIFYEYKSGNEMIFRKITHLKILRKDVSVYRGKYLWTGCGKISAKIETSKFLYNEVNRNDVYQWYEVWFGKYLKKKDEVDFQIKWELIDDSNSAIPILCAFITEPMKQIVLNLKLPVQFNVKNVVCEEFESITTNKSPIKTFTKDLIDGEVTWGIDKPKMFHRYLVKWDMETKKPLSR